MASAESARSNCSRNALSLNICASSESICRCRSVARSGTSNTKIRLTGWPSGASNGIGSRMRIIAPTASFRPLMRPCGIAIPWPRPVEPSFSRANRLSNTTLRAMPCWFSNSNPACSNRRFLLDTWRPTTTLAACRCLAMRLIRDLEPRGADYSVRVALPRSGGRLLALQRFVRARLQLVLVALHLAIELVGEQIDRGIQVGLLALAMQVLAAHVQGDFRLLRQLVHGQNHMGIDHVVEMPRDALQLGAHVSAYCRGHFEMMAAHVQVHQDLLWDGVAVIYKDFLWLTGGICRDSRYFAIVRPATTIPCSASTCEMRAS